MHPEDPAESRALVRTYGPVVALGLTAVLISIVTRHTIYSTFSWNRDEPVYLWHTEILRSGRLTSADGGAPELFYPWLGGARAGVLFSQYSPGWPLALLSSRLLFGGPAGAVALGAVLTVVGTYALALELTRDRTVALVAGVVMLSSPIFAVQSGVFLSYLFTLGLGLLFAAAMLSGVRLRRPLRIAVAGALLGWVFLTRPFDAVLWGAAVAVHVLITRRKDGWRLLQHGLWFAAGVLPFVIAGLAYNHRITGSFSQFPITAAEPLDKFGFGYRRIMPTFHIVQYDVGKAFTALAKNGLLLPIFAAGSYLAVPVALYGLWQRRRHHATIALLSIALAFPAGYFFFFGLHISSLAARFGGPIYFIPIYAPLSILTASVIVTLWRQRRTAGIALVALLAVTTVPFAASRLSVNRAMSRAQLPWKQAHDSIQDKAALVFIAESGPFLMFLDPYSANGPNLDGRLLFATNRGPAILDAIARFPQRTPYLEASSLVPDDLLPSEHPGTPKVTVTKLQVLRSGSITITARVTNPTNQPTVRVLFNVGEDSEWRTLSTSSFKGAVHETSWIIGDGGFAPRRDRIGGVDVTVGFGRTPAEADAAAVVRKEYYYRQQGAEYELLVPALSERLVAQDGEPKRDWKVIGTAAPELELTATAR